MKSMLNKVTNIPKKVYLGLGVAVSALIAIICIATAGPTIHLNDYLSIEESGYDGYGRVNIRIDWDAMEDAYGDKLKLKEEQNAAQVVFWGVIEPIDVLKDEIDINYEWSNEWNNGDEIAYTWEVSDYISDLVNCKVKHKDGFYKVNGLQEVETFDAFEMLKVEFSGVEPNGILALEHSGKYLTTSDFSSDKEEGLREGDTVTISIEDFDAETFLETHGVLPKEMEKTYSVPELGKYINTCAEISDVFIEKLKTDAKDAIEAYEKDVFLSTSHISELKYEGHIFRATNKPDATSSTYNEVFVLYSGEVSSSNNSFKSATVFFPVKFINIHTIDGELKYEGADGIAGKSYLDSNTFFYSYYTNGYTDPYLCYEELVTYQETDYVAEVAGEFEKYVQR